jgi:hypothetical protein
MTRNQSSPTHKDSLTVHRVGSASESVVKDSLTTALRWRARDREQTIAGNVAEILEA